MRTYPIPFNEPFRLAAVRDLPGLNADSEPLFDKLTEAARVLFDCPVAHISVVEDEHQWYKAVVGMDLPEIPRDYSFCAHAIMSDDFMVVPDLSAHPRFADHPMVANPPHARFYAGAPIILSSGHRVGSLCALDLVPHDQPSETAMATLRVLADTVATALERVPPDPVVTGEAAPDGKEEFIALIGHEFRTPLTKILGYSSLLEMQLDGKGGKLAQAAAGAARHMQQLCETIIRFAMASTGDLQLNETEVSLRGMVEEACMIHGPVIEGAGKRIEMGRFDVPDHITADESQLRLALSALIDNATLHGGTALEITAGLNAEGDIEIELHDNGDFESLSVITELYRPFVVGGDLDTREAGGLGLGLPLTRKLVELHGGTFEVTAGDQKTIARIVLPGWRAQKSEPIFRVS